MPDDHRNKINFLSMENNKKEKKSKRIAFNRITRKRIPNIITYAHYRWEEVPGCCGEKVMKKDSNETIAAD